MANIKISQLPVLATPTDITIVPVVDTGTNKTVTASSLASYVHTKIPTASTSLRGGVKIDGVTITTNGSGQLVSVFTGGTVSAATTFSSTVNITGSVVSPATAVGNVIAFNYDNQAAFPSASTYHGAILHSHADGRMYMGHGGWQAMALLSDITSYSLPTATTTVLGGVKIDGSTITINGSGVISSTGGSVYTLPTATTTVLGGVKIDGSTITINGSGVISSTGGSVYTLPTATTTVLGGVKIDGSTITISGSGVISSASAYSLPTASTTVLGGVKIDGSTITLNGSNQLIANYTTYTLPTATTTVLGGVKVDGSTITINGSGVIAATGAGAVTYKGTWNASTNTPTLTNGVGTAGFQYAVSVAGTTNFGAGNITFTVGDLVLYSGTVWQQIAAGGIAAAGTLTGTVLASNVVTSSLTAVGTLTNLTVTNTITGSVSGSAGTVTSISANTITSGQVTTALGFTPYSNTNPSSYITTSALTSYALTASVPTNTNQLTNGSGYITTSALTSYALTASVPTNTNQLTNGSGYVTSATVIPAITRLDVTANGSTAYLFNNQYAGSNPTIYAISGTTIAFNLNVSGHPFLIRLSGANYDTGLIHVSTSGVVSTGSSAQGQTSGTLYWQVPQGASGAYGYLCLYHGGMIGTITVKQIASLP